MSSRVGGALVVALAVVVVVLTGVAWVDFHREVDRTAARVADAPTALPDAAPSPSPTEQATVRSLWIGDGYTAGACGAAAQLGWLCDLDAEQGTGFLSDGTVYDAGNKTLGDRLADLPGREPDVVVVDAGRNDLGVFATAAVLDAMDGYLGRLREQYPDAVLLQVLPWTREQPTPDPAVADAVTALMKQYDGYVVDPAGEILEDTALADRIRALDLPVPVQEPAQE